MRSSVQTSKISNLPVPLRGPVLRTIGNDERPFWLKRKAAAFAAPDRGQGFSTHFSRSGLGISARGERLSLRLAAVGYGSTLRPLARRAPNARRNRLSYAHGGLTEWYANGPLGIEQGFTVHTRPAGPQAGPLTLAMRLGGSLKARLAHGRVSFLDKKGRVVLRYQGLSVKDARGRSRHAWLSLGRGLLLLRVNVAQARYPLEIDPFIQQGPKLTPSDGDPSGSYFGASAALSSDGNTALIGGWMDGSCGAAWVFTRSGSTWTQQGSKLTPSGGCGGFGASVALSSDGNTALIGAPNDNGNAGAAFVFARSGAAWAQQAKLAGSDTQQGLFGSYFGSSVALSSDGNTALIGAPLHNRDATGTNTGSAWVFTRSSAPAVWAQQGPPLAPSLEVGDDSFGWSVALSSDGNTAVIGGIYDNNHVGAVWVFTRAGTSWSQQGPKLTSNDQTAGDVRFGYSVALSSDGNTALIGTYLDNEVAGAAWVFTRAGSTWTQQGPKLTANDPGGGGAYGYSFGYSVALSSDGNSALIGGPNSNAAWVFTRSGSTWSQLGPRLSPNDAADGYAANGSNFGVSVALSSDGNSALIGGPDDNQQVGAAWAFGNSSAPAPPTLSDTDPDSPANHNSPRVKGSAAPGSTVKLYTNASCTSAVAASGSAADLVSPGLQVTVADDSSTTFYATATDQAGNVSGCSTSSITYVEDSTAPDRPTPDSDGDGLPDSADACPRASANAANGCPPLLRQPGLAAPLGTDTTAPAMTLRGKRTQRLAKTISVVVSTSESVSVAVSGNVSVAPTNRAAAKAQKIYRLRSIRNRFVARGSATLRLGLPKKARNAIRRALRQRRKVRAKLRVTATDAAGNTTVRTLAVRLKR